jgi:hypothetical protein
MVAAVAGVWALLLGTPLLMIGNGLQGSLLGVRASLEGFGTTVTDLLMSGCYRGFLASSTLTPKLVARVGHIRAFGAIGLFAIWRTTRRRALPLAEQGPYVVLPRRATPTASALCAEAAQAEATPAEQPIARAG